MYYKPGQTIAKFRSKKGKDIILKIPKLSWSQKYQKFINSIIAEDDYILLDKLQTVFSEKEFIKKQIQQIKNKMGVCLTAFCKDEIIGSSTLNFAKGRSKHLATFGIAIKDGFRGEGIGTKMMKILSSIAKKSGIKIIELKVFETNKRAQNAYKKFGFKKCGSIPESVCRRGKYINDIVMYKLL